MPAVGVSVALVTFAAVLFIGWWVRARARAPAMIPYAVTALFCVSVGLVAATPVEAEWTDGCNEHGGRVPLLAAPQVWLGTDDDIVLAYEDVHTLRGCTPDLTIDE